MVKRGLSLKLSCVTLIFLLVGCNLDNQRASISECRGCESELLELDSYKKMCELRLSVVDSIFNAIQRIDSALTKSILGYQMVQEDNNKTMIAADLLTGGYIEESACRNQLSKKSQFESNIMWLKSTEIKCNEYFLQIKHFAKKDSAYRAVLNLELVPFDTLFEAYNNRPNKSDSLWRLDLTNKLDCKVDELFWQVFMVNRSYNEISDYSGRN